MTKATGTFEVKLSPLEFHVSGVDLGRLALDKQFFGDLTATSLGEMLSALTSVKGSAGYVAIELEHRAGSFVLIHTGTMTRGVPQLVIGVVPDSGTDQLMGLSGSMTINIVDGEHFYDFEYTLENHT
jgi:hypothetical protein